MDIKRIKEDIDVAKSSLEVLGMRPDVMYYAILSITDILEEIVRKLEEHLERNEYGR